MKQDKQLLLTLTGSAHDTILQTITEILHRFKGKFVRTHFHRLDDQFSGVLHLSLSSLYLKPFIACLESLENPGVRFQFKTLDPATAYHMNQQVKINFEVWGKQSAELNLGIFKILGNHQFKIENLSESYSSSMEDAQVTTEISAVTDFVVDNQEVEQELQELAREYSATIMMLNDDLDDEFGVQEAI